MIPKYHEKSVEVAIHSERHAVCPPEHQAELEPGWECSCDECRCEYVITVQAMYAFDHSNLHKVVIRDADFAALTPDTARALASALMFAANDADQLNQDFPI